MKKVVTTFLAAVLTCGAGHALVTSFPYQEGFEGDGVSLPEGWTQQQVSEASNPEWGTTKTWVVGAVNDWNFSPQTVHGGTYKVAFGTDYMGGSVAKLITPAFDLSGISDPELKFWRTQQSLLGVNALKIYYRTAADSEWILLETFDTETPDWTQAVLKLPNPSAYYQIAFEGHDMVGNWLQIDDVKIAAAPTGPVISENPVSFNMGVVYNNLPFGGYTALYKLRNSGVKTLNVNSLGAGTDSRLSVEGLPLAVNPGEEVDMAVTLDDPNTMDVGFFNGKMMLESNDPDTPVFTVDVSASVASANVSTYVNEVFGTQFGETPEGWSFISGGFLPNANEGAGGSPCIQAYFNGPKPGIQTGYVAMGSDPVLSFEYKVLQQAPGVFDHIMPVPADAFGYEVSISKDNGVTWDVLTLNPQQHGASSGFTRVEADVAGYAGEVCMVRIMFEIRGELNNPKVSLDNVIIGTAPANDLAAVSLRGLSTPIVNAPAQYKVKVANNGSVAQNDYTVRLMQKDPYGNSDTEIARQEGIAIADGETKEFMFEWIPQTEGFTGLYGEVILPDDEFEINDRTPVFQLTVQPAGFSNVMVGNGSDKYYYLPYNTYYMQSLTQSLYFPHELGTNHATVKSLTYNAEIKQGVVDLQNIPVQIWMGETERTDLSDGWADPEGLTLVYDGTLSFPVGEYDVTVNLTTPYEYKGGNLVIYSFRKKVSEGAYGNMDNNFKCTTYPGSARSRANYLVDDEVFDPMRPDDIDIVMPMDFIPNTNFMLDLSGTGVMTGNISSSAIALEGAQVKVAGTDLYVLTDAAGNYKLPLAPGDYRIEASKHGYFAEEFDITLEENGSVTRDVELRPIPVYTVSGKVTAADASEGVRGVKVTLSGYDDYAAVTDASGAFVITGVYENNSYSIKAEKPLYNAYESVLEMSAADVEHNIGLVLTPYPVFRASAVKSDSGVTVNWDAPVAGRGADYVIDDDTPDSGESVNPGNDVRMGNKYETSDKGVLKSVTILGLENTLADGKAVTVEVYDANRTLVGTSDPFIIPADAWVNVPLDNIPYNGTFYVMVRWQATDGNTNWVAADNDGPNADKMWGMAYANGEWNSMYTLFRKHCVFMIRPEGLIVDRSVTPAPKAYTVYRMAKGDENAPDEWTEVSVTSDLSCADGEWALLPEGSYRYAVSSSYAGEGNVSEPVFTKSVTADKSGIASVNCDVRMRVFPNPVVDILNIETDSEIERVEVIDRGGRTVISHTGNERSIDLGSLSAGYYIVRIVTDGGAGSVSVIKR